MYTDRLKSSFSGFWHNPALLGVMFLEFIARTIMIAAFLILDGLTLYWINKDVVSTSLQLDWQMFMNPKTIIVLGLLFVIQLFILLYVNSFFMAGFFGMVKNYVQDGKTTFNEFMPSVKRYWSSIFRFLFIRYAILILIAIPVAIAFFSYMGTSPAFITTSQTVYLIISGTIAFLLGAAAYLAMFYGESAIVFEDKSASQAVVRSWDLMKENFGTTFLAALTALVLLIIASAIVALLLWPFDIILQNTLGDSSWQLVRDIAEWTFNVVTISATIIISIFMMLTYKMVAGGNTARPAVAASKPAVKAEVKPAAKPAVKKPVKKSKK